MAMADPHRRAPRPARERAWLERLYQRYHHPRFVAPDPLQCLAPYGALRDREVAAVVASALAYGNVTAMLAAIAVVLARLGPTPAATLAASSPARLRRQFRGFRYRFTDERRLTGLLEAVRRAQHEHGRLAALVVPRPGETTVVPALGRFVAALRDAAPCPLDHLLPHPDGGSACKRPFLMLRWMARRDAVDPGGWDAVAPALLVVPLDTHVFRIARHRGWTTRRTPGLRTALEITETLRRIRPDDPLRYDFAITRPGIRRDAAVSAAFGIPAGGRPLPA